MSEYIRTNKFDTKNLQIYTLKKNWYERMSEYIFVTSILEYIHHTLFWLSLQKWSTPHPTRWCIQSPPLMVLPPSEMVILYKWYSSIWQFSQIDVVRTSLSRGWDVMHKDGKRPNWPDNLFTEGCTDCYWGQEDFLFCQFCLGPVETYRIVTLSN